MAEPRDTTNERWTFDDQRGLQALGVTDFYTQSSSGYLIGAFPHSHNLWTDNRDDLIDRAKELMTKYPDSDLPIKLYSLLVGQKLRAS